MALIKCPECSTDVSDKAVSCPKCGYPMQTTTPQSPAEVDSFVKQALMNDGKIAAIKRYRTCVPGAGLAEAKQYVERLEASLPPGSVKPASSQGCLSVVVLAGLVLAACALVLWIAI